MSGHNNSFAAVCKLNGIVNKNTLTEDYPEETKVQSAPEEQIVY